MFHRSKFFLPHSVAFLVAAALLPTAQIVECRGEQGKGRAVSKQTFTYKVVRDCEIQADVYRFPDTVVHPAIFEIHGGALIMGNRNSPNRVEIEKYVRAGYVVISIDYRLAPETKLKEIIEDVQDAYGWVRTKGPGLYFIDPNRIGVMGGSAGGYLTLMTGFCVRPRPKALVSFFGYGDIAGPWLSQPDPFYNTQPAIPKQEAYLAVSNRPISGSPATPGDPRSRFYLYCRQHGLWPKEVVGHDPDTEPRAFDPFCPVRNVTQDYPPTMLLHGDKDTDVPFDQSVQMAKELERHGVENEFIRIPNGGHGFDTTQHFDRVLAFLDKHLK
jgi:acetyl esterase/lipase